MFLARLVPRRTLFTTPQLAAKRGRPPKPKDQPKPKGSPATHRPLACTSSDLKPPKRAPSPYILFYTSFLKSQPKADTIQDYQQFSKRAGEIWKGYSMAEKKPYYDENEARKAQATQERDEFFRNTSPSDLKKLNKARKERGKTKIHSVIKHSKPASPFLLFSKQFRNSPEGQAVINDTSSEKNHNVRVALAAGERWRSMSDKEKAPFSEMFQKEKETFKAGQTGS